MEDETLPPYVQHRPSDASVPFVHGEAAPLKTPPKRTWTSRCTAMGLLKVAVAVLLITAVASLLSFFLQRGEPAPSAEYLIITDAPAEGAAPSRVQHETVLEARAPPTTVRRARRRTIELGTISVPETRKGVAALPDVTNFTLVAADNRYITLAWNQPRRSIDFYLLDVTGGSGYENGSLRKQRVGTCSKGTFVHAGQTQVTCGPFVACSKLSATIRTYTTGPPERTSKGTTLNELFISGEEPSEPKSITMVAKSPSMTRLQWEPPACIHGLVDVYKVKVCETFSECDQKQNLSGCFEYEASDTWLDFDSTEDTPYCVLITASSRCGDKVLTSLPAMQEVRTPLFSLPDVSNLRLVSAKSGHITLSWQRPKGRFDYYSVEVTEDKVSSTDTAKHWLGLCANGTIIRPDQTVLTCGPLEPCRNLSCTMRTHLSGPPERSSPGVTLTGIYIPAEDPNPPRNLTMFPESPSRTHLHWQQPEKVSGIIVSYNLKICSTFGSCDRGEGLSNCAEYLTTERWTAFDSSVDTSYCVLVTVKTRCSFDEVSSRPLIAEIRTPIFALPDAINLRLLSAMDNSITVAWERPQGRFDYFWLSIVDNDDEGHDNAQKGRVGSCGNGTIIHPNQTWATCPNLKACTKVSVTLRTHSNGPPERTSHGVSLQGIFIPGKDPDPPRNITMAGKSPSLTRLQWEPSAKVDGRLLAYTVKICDTFKSCSGEPNMQGCIELQAHETWLDFHSSVDTKYCVLVATSAQCGEQVLNGRAAVAEIRTPLPVLPDVSNLNLMAADDHYITVAWDAPRGTFDFYWLEVTNENDSLQKYHVGSCGNGTIIRAEQTQVTCGPFDPCSNISVTVRTFVKGPPARTSMGTTLKGVFLSGQDPSEPKNITIVAKSPSMARLQWEPPTRIHGILDVYKVKVCKEYTVCERNESTGGCNEHTVSDAWLDFGSTADTSYCALITASARCGVDVLTSLPATLQVRTPSFDPPDVTKLTLLAAGNNYITVAWERPKDRFDYYWVSIIDGTGEKHGQAGSCANGTIIHPDQTQVTCRSLEACTNVTVSLRTHRNGPPERTSIGIALQDIFVPGKDPDPPRNITMVGKSPSLTRLQWEPSAKVYGRFLAYTVKICDTFKSCSGEANLQGCIELQAHETWLDFHSSVDTKYCVLVRTSSQCGEQVLNGRAAAAEIRTPLPVLPDVQNLDLKAADNHYITVAWDAPRGTFDFYWLDVTNENDNEKDSVQKHHVGSCGNGTIIRAEQTQVTCGPFDPCSNISVTVRTFIKGPPARTSMGTTLKGVFLSGQDPSEPKSISIAAKSPSTARLQWEPPTSIHGILEVYKVKVCKEYTVCDRNESIGGCFEHTVSDAWLDFQSTADASYCALITANARCGVDVLRSLPATLQVRTPSFDPPEVTKLKVLSAGNNYITVAWERPKDRFDYYWVSITDDRGEKHRNAGSCTNGTIIHPDQTQVTCRSLDACTNVTVNIRTHRNGPPERTSMGVALQNVFVPGKACPQKPLFQWVAWRGNTVPENAVPGGQDKSGTLYICRAKQEGLFIPGKLASWDSTCYVPYGRGRRSYNTYEVLVAGDPS